MAERPRILLVEDDIHLGFLLKDLLVEHGFLVSHCSGGEEAITEFNKFEIQLCLLDVTLPTMDGFDLAKKLRTINVQVPFIFITARSLKTDTLKGYALGAEDYITKPFDEQILLCKIGAILKRTSHYSSPPMESEKKVFPLGKYTFDYHAHALLKGDQCYRLTEKENEVLYLLCTNKNKVVRRDDAVERIYGKQDYFLGRSFDVFISKLRKHLAEDPSISIENVFKVGFILNVNN
ncbi:MAG: response regulator transcription factor [Saprospiraceae bacterium]|nr:response regulator transcription factor [Saprospiraceae bacterium]